MSPACSMVAARQRSIGETRSDQNKREQRRIEETTGEENKEEERKEETGGKWTTGEEIEWRMETKIRHR